MVNSMKVFKKALICILALVVLITPCSTAMSETIYTIDGYSYVINNNDLASIVGWDNRSDTLVIPNKIGDIYVSDIADNAFLNDDYIKQLDLFRASRLYSIGMFAFSNSALEGALSIPTNITSIGIGAFEGCTGLTELVFSSNGGIVPAQCFRNCKNLQKITLSSFITTIQYYAFSGCENLQQITIPRSVVSISRSAFSDDPNVVIRCYYNSYAHQFAVDNGYDFVLIDAPAPTEPPTEPQTEAPTQAPTDEPTQPATEAPTAEPTQPATEKPTESTGFILGDVDNNGVVSISDVTLIQRSLVNLDIPASCVISQGDVDNNGITGSSDAAFIMRYLINLTTGYPIGEIVTR